MIIYCILFPNGKRYIGKTECSLEKRKVQHKHHSKYGKTTLYNAIRKYGWDNLDWVILEECENVDTLNRQEEDWIRRFKTLNYDKGYNLREGGEGGKHHETTKMKISLANSGENNGMYGKTSWNKGKKLTKEHRENLSKAHQGQVPWNKGKTLPKRGPQPEGVKRKISKSNSGENNGQAKLNCEIVKKIREMYSTGNYKQKELCEIFCLTSERINRIVNNKVWRNCE